MIDRIGKMVIALVLSISLVFALSAASAPVRQGLDIVLPLAPTTIETDDGLRLVYEMHLTSFAAEPLTLRRLDVLDDSGRILATYTGDDLARLIEQIGPAPAVQSVVAPGRRAIVYFDVALQRPTGAIAHRITFEPSGSGQISSTIDVAPVRLDTRPLARLGPPVRGGPWVAVYAPEMARGHRRVSYATRGRARVPGRFAIDWFKVDARGRNAAGPERAQDWPSYGADVLAVADATVAATRDGVAEPVSTSERRSVAIGDAAGNYVALDIGGGRYAFYEHLQPGLRVSPGDRVRRGDVIGKVGFSGQTTGPHLHFHLADANDPLDAEGLPYLMSSAQVIGAYPSLEAVFTDTPWTPRQPKTIRPSFPSPNVVIRFPG